MHWLIVLAALIVWHGLMLVVLWYIPLPPRLERWKPAIMVGGLAVAFLLVIHHTVHAQAPTPTPLRPLPKPVYVPIEQPVINDDPAPAPATAPDWQRFQGATRCEQSGGRLICDNGYRRETAR
jgi:hypothetical protein